MYDSFMLTDKCLHGTKKQKEQKFDIEIITFSNDETTQTRGQKCKTELKRRLKNYESAVLFCQNDCILGNIWKQINVWTS